MPQLPRSTIATIVSGLALGCGDGGGGPSLSLIVGTWTATKIEVVSVANPSTKLNLTTLGATASVVLNSNQTFTATFVLPGEPPDVSTGTYTYSAGNLTLTDTSSVPAETLSFTVVVTGSTMLLSGAIVEIDFGAGSEDATLNLTLTK